MVGPHGLDLLRLGRGRPSCSSRWGHAGASLWTSADAGVEMWDYASTDFNGWEDGREVVQDNLISTIDNAFV